MPAKPTSQKPSIRDRAAVGTSTSSIQYEEYIGHIMVLKPVRSVEALETKFGVKYNVPYCNVTAIDVDSGHAYNAGEEVPIFPEVIAGACYQALQNGTEYVVGVLGKTGRAWTLSTDMSDSDWAAVEAWETSLEDF
jgi:hypothetical protein